MAALFGFHLFVPAIGIIFGEDVGEVIPSAFVDFLHDGETELFAVFLRVFLVLLVVDFRAGLIGFETFSRLLAFAENVGRKRLIR